MQKKNIIIISVLGLILGLLSIFNPFSFTTKNQAYRYYKQGLSLYNQGDFQNAYYNFGKVGKNTHIYPLAIYRQANCAEELRDYKSAIRKYKIYVKSMKDANLAPVGYWELGELYYGGGNYLSAKRYFKTLQKKYPNSDFSYAANFRLGEIERIKKHPQKANEYYLKYLSHAPLGRFSMPCVKQMILSNNEEKLIVAISLYENQEHKKSIDVLNSINDNSKWYYLGKNYFAINNKYMGKEAFLKVLQTMEQEDGEILNDILKFIDVEPKTIKNPTVLPALLFHQAQKNSKIAITNYNRIYKQSPNSFYAPESLWEIFWNFYKNRQYSEALKISRLHALNFSNSNSAPKMLYFSGKIKQKVKDTYGADKFFKKIMDDYPDSYYAYRANEQLNREGQAFQSVKSIPLREQARIVKIPLKSSYLDELLKLQDFYAISSFKIEDEFLKSWILRSRGNISYSVVLARDEMAQIETKPPINDSKWELIYPIYYNKIINVMAQSASLSPELVIAIVKEESFFDAKAKSAAGAVGLMQLMPQTIQFIEKGAYNPSRIYEPYYNIYLGCKYFSSLKNQFNGSELFAVASYNGGPGNVIKWKKEFFNGDLDDFVEDIPYIETKVYVKKIYSSYWNYLRIYGK